MTAASPATPPPYPHLFAPLDLGFATLRNRVLMKLSRRPLIAAPLIAGTLVVTIGVAGVLVIDLATFAVAATTLILVRLPTAVTRPRSRL